MHLSSVGMPVLCSYEQALNRFKETKPYRSGSTKGQRPLGANRRYKECLIEHDEESGEVFLTLYGTQLVAWQPDNTMRINLGGYNSASTRQFITGCTPYNIKYGLGVTHLQVGTRWFMFPNDREQLIIKDGEVQNIATSYAYKMDRFAHKKVKERFAPFREYITNMGKIITGIDTKEIKLVFDQCPIQPIRLSIQSSQWHHRLHQKTGELPLDAFISEVERAQKDDDLEAYYKLFIQLGVSSLIFISTLNAYVRSWGERDVEIGTPIVNHFDEILKYVFRDEIFIKEEVPVGTIGNKKNSKYFLA